MTIQLHPEEIISFIRTEFPLFDSIVDTNEGMYDVLGNFAIFLRNGISENSLSDIELKQVFKVMNTMGSAKELEVKNLLVVGIFEILTDVDKVVEVVKSGLEGEAAELFQRVLVGWRNG